MGKVNQGGFRVAIFTSYINCLTMQRILTSPGRGDTHSTESQDKYRVHIAIWDAFEGLNQVSLGTFMHLLHSDFVSKVYHASFSLALTLRSNLLPADLCCLFNPAQCAKPITQLTHIEISY